MSNAFVRGGAKTELNWDRLDTGLRNSSMLFQRESWSDTFALKSSASFFARARLMRRSLDIRGRRSAGFVSPVGAGLGDLLDG